MTKPGHSMWATARTGLVRSGQYAGRYVSVERDESKTGWHIWLLERPPGIVPNSGYDIWADDEEQVSEWFEAELQSVDWL